ncbi:MAG: glycosyl hydrolase, partial [Planctomycetota bacterium]
MLSFLETLGSDATRGRKIIAGHFCGGGQAIGWSGWQEFARGMGPWEFSMREVDEIKRRTGQTVGLIDCWIAAGEPYDGWTRPDGERFEVEKHGIVSDDEKKLIETYVAWHQAGGISHVSASPWAPLATRYGFRSCGEDPGYNREDIVLDRILREGTPENLRWRFQLDKMAEFFHALEREGLPVVFRPFTEQEGTSRNGWWYSRGVIGANGH